jgi:hypothetical protein
LGFAGPFALTVVVLGARPVAADAFAFVDEAVVAFLAGGVFFAV